MGYIIDSVTDVFAAFGGPTAVSKVLGVNKSTASEMKRRGSIPVKYWHALLAEAAARRLPLDQRALIDMHTRESAE